MTTTAIVYPEIKRGMALAFFASAWADQEEESGNAQGGEIMDRMPEEIDPAALEAADTLAAQLIEGFTYDEPGLNEKQKLALVYRLALRADSTGADRELTPELFGHYLAMQAMGSGVGLESFGSAVHDAIPVPYVEFSGYQLSRDYFDQEGFDAFTDVKGGDFEHIFH